MRTPTWSDSKCESLRASATLNPHPERVTEALFQSHPFFDARDLVQVRYEMLRRVILDGQSVGAAAAAFGFSRVTLHHLRQRFEVAGLAGLLPRAKGPRRAHKLSDEVLAFILHLLEAQPDLRMAELPVCVAQQFGVSVQLRSIERALARQRKKDRACRGHQRRPFPPPRSRCSRPKAATKPCVAKPWSQATPGARIWKWGSLSGKV